MIKKMKADAELVNFVDGKLQELFHSAADQRILNLVLCLSGLAEKTKIPTRISSTHLMRILLFQAVAFAVFLGLSRSDFEQAAGKAFAKHQAVRGDLQ